MSKYINHRNISTRDVIYLKYFGPPSSPPTTFDLLNNNISMAIKASEQKIVTENAKLKRKVNNMYAGSLIQRVTYEDRRKKEGHCVITYFINSSKAISIMHNLMKIYESYFESNFYLF